MVCAFGNRTCSAVLVFFLSGVLHMQDTPKTTAYPHAQGICTYLSPPIFENLSHLPPFLPTHREHSTELLHLSLEELESENPR